MNDMVRRYACRAESRGPIPKTSPSRQRRAPSDLGFNNIVGVGMQFADMWKL